MPKNLFELGRKAQIQQESPLANRMRPRTLDEYVGQDHILGHGRLLRRAIQADQLSSLIFYGPPGTGKTTLAMVIANTTESHFITINAVLSGVKEIREAIADAHERRNLYGQRTTLFVDEVHRWNKAQQDALLPHVEKGTIILIGATTENPYFEVNKALVSRSRIFQLKPLTEENLRAILHQAINDEERGYGKETVVISPAAEDHLVNVANGDARSVLNALELAVETTEPTEDGTKEITLAVAEESIQRRAVLYDKDGDAHYDTISAFIKSLRGSDPDAALYWAAKMIYAGEDARYIFRRMGIFAGEDVGLADPHAASIVESCWALYERIGMPEGQFPLAKAILYLATAPKSNSTLGFFDAFKAVQEEKEAEVPSPMRDGNRDKEGFGHGIGYKYPHAYQDHWVAQQYLPTALQGKLFYQPNRQGYEGTLVDLVQARREAQLAILLTADEEAAEILTNSPERRGREAWLQRTMSTAGDTLRQLRTLLFEKANIARHHVVLDLKADSGLLLWEAVRQAPEGGVWGITSEENLGQLSQLAGRLLDLEQPTLHTSVEDVIASGQQFDRLIAYNALTRLLEQKEKLGLWLALLLPEGTLTLAQVVPRRGQRIVDLVSWEGDEEGLAAHVRAAEEALWRDSANPATAWGAAELQHQINDAGWDGQSEMVELVEERRLSPALVRRWFEPDNPYRNALVTAGLTDAQIETVAGRIISQLSGKTVSWRVDYVMGRFSSGGTKEGD